MLNAIFPFVGFTATGLVLVILAVDHHLRAGRARAAALRVVPVAADVTQRLPVIVTAPSGALRVTPPLPPASFRRQPVPPQPPRHRSCRPPDRPANPRSEARLITPWGDLTRLPGSDEPGIVPSTLATSEGV
ncbi:MAG: hypothetical protein OEW29_02950 [Acidimicrobiia bacterium]|nr:hypothetical protein [Acidimicrobiia bacterium]